MPTTTQTAAILDPRDPARKLVRAVARLHPVDFRRCIRGGALRELGRHRSERRRLYLVSSTLDFLADPVGDHLDIPNRYTTCLEIRDGCYTGQVLGVIYYGARKGELLRQLAVREGIDLRRSFAYGDSIQDAAMLSVVGHPFAVNPDRQLETLARSQNWPIAQWS